MRFDRNSFYDDVGQRLKIQRKRRGHTQQQTSAAIGISRASYANMEAGRQTVALDVAWRAAVHFRVPLERLAPEPVFPEADSGTLSSHHNSSMDLSPERTDHDVLQQSAGQSNTQIDSISITNDSSS